MQGLILVTWEKFLAAQFSELFLTRYRSAIGQTQQQAPLAARVYDDTLFYTGITAASALSGTSASLLLRAYGRYFITNALTSHLCAYLLSRAQSARDLIQIMGQAHLQMRQGSDTIMPPIFRYGAPTGDLHTFTIIYDSNRQLCPLLWGAIEGAAERFQEQAQINESTCMKQGDQYCTFKVRITPLASQKNPPETREQRKRRYWQQQLEHIVWNTLPCDGGLTLAELQTLLSDSQAFPGSPRLSIVLETLHRLQYAGLVSCTDHESLLHRRYCRIPVTSGAPDPAKP